MASTGDQPQSSPLEMLKDGPDFRGADLPKLVPGLTWQLIYFAAACVVCAAGVLAVLDLIFNAFSVLESPFVFLNCIYLCLFGGLMLLLDFPFVQSVPRIHEFRALLYHFMLFLTRKIGRGIWYFFLGSLVFAQLWDNSINAFLAVVLGGFVGLVGLAALYVGAMLTRKLNLARKQLREGVAARGTTEPTAVASYLANKVSAEGLDCDAFNGLLAEFSKEGPMRSMKFSPADMEYVAIGLSHDVRNLKGDGVIAKEDFDRWVSGDDVALL
mmetsp:Transcript_8170/g.20180  ORF Transcript_8170/g.20180 Transcript_8170/m.20180 type:complete len:270 (-) Transcript_8170:171-980(-)